MEELKEEKLGDGRWREAGREPGPELGQSTKENRLHLTKVRRQMSPLPTLSRPQALTGSGSNSLQMLLLRKAP